MAGKLFHVDIVTPEASDLVGCCSDGLGADDRRGHRHPRRSRGDHGGARQRACVITDADDEVTTIGIHGGFLQIYANTVTLLTDRAEKTEGGRDEALRLAEEFKAAEQRAMDAAEAAEG